MEVIDDDFPSWQQPEKGYPKDSDKIIPAEENCDIQPGKNQEYFQKSVLCQEEFLNSPVSSNSVTRFQISLLEDLLPV